MGRAAAIRSDKNERTMELSPTDARLKSIGNIELFKTDEKHDFKSTDMLRMQRRSPLRLVDAYGNLCHASVTPVGNGTARSADSIFARRLTDEALVVYGLQAEGFNGGS